MRTRDVSVIAYFTIVGWIIAYYSFSRGGKHPLLQYHLKQSFGFMLLGLLLGLVITVVSYVSAAVAGALSWLGILYFIFMVLGMINALNETYRPIPLIGQYFENNFLFIK